MSIRRLKSRGIGRLELLAWLNELLETDYTKLEHLADGIAYCQIFDALHPGKVQLQQINFHARSRTEYERNFRVLVRAFHACDIRKEVPIRKLVDGVFQEHFEFLHWIHDYVHKTYPEALSKYNGFARRQQVLGVTTSSLLDLQGANLNLIPSYAISSKIPSDAYLSSTGLGKLELIDPDEVSLSLEELAVTSMESPPALSQTDMGEDQPRPTGPEIDPLLRYARHSHSSTLEATELLAQLEKTIALVLPDPTSMQKSNGLKNRGGNATKSRSKSVPSKKAQPAETDESIPPILAPQLNHLIDVLAAELEGRAKDLEELEAEVQGLRSA